MDEELRFHWGELIEDAVKDVKQPALIALCRSAVPHMASAIRSRKDAYQFIASQNPTTQGLIFNDVQALLAKPDIHTCTARWILKRKREEEELEIRNIRSRLDTINAGLESHGISVQFLWGLYKPH